MAIEHGDRWSRSRRFRGSTQIYGGLALGLRLRLEGIATTVRPTLFDPPELRSKFDRIVRYLHDNGAFVQQEKPYVELEAMKVIMPVKASASGKIIHTRGAGSMVSAGELGGSLELDDPIKRAEDCELQGP